MSLEGETFGSGRSTAGSPRRRSARLARKGCKPDAGTWAEVGHSCVVGRLDGGKKVLGMGGDSLGWGKDDDSLGWGKGGDSQG